MDVTTYPINKDKPPYCDVALKGKSGVYAIRRLSTGGCYVGASRNLMNRMREHRTNLLREHGGAYRFHGVFDGAPPGDVVFEVLEECDVENLVAREWHWIKELQPDANNRIPTQVSQWLASESSASPSGSPDFKTAKQWQRLSKSSA